MPVFDDDHAIAALGRRVIIAQSDTGQVRRVADFLAARWNADDGGRFDFRDLWMVDCAIADGILAVARLVSIRHEYPTAYGYGPHCERLLADWRPLLSDRPEAGRASLAAPERGTVPPSLPLADACSGARLGGTPPLPRGCGEGAGH